jgi:hypothetical protein
MLDNANFAIRPKLCSIFSLDKENFNAVGVLFHRLQIHNKVGEVLLEELLESDCRILKAS